MEQTLSRQFSRSPPPPPPGAEEVPLSQPPTPPVAEPPPPPVAEPPPPPVAEPPPPPVAEPPPPVAEPPPPPVAEEVRLSQPTPPGAEEVRLSQPAPPPGAEELGLSQPPPPGAEERRLSQPPPPPGGEELRLFQQPPPPGAEERRLSQPPPLGTEVLLPRPPTKRRTSYHRRQIGSAPPRLEEVPNDELVDAWICYVCKEDGILKTCSICNAFFHDHCGPSYQIHGADNYKFCRACAPPNLDNKVPGNFCDHCGILFEPGHHPEPEDMIYQCFNCSHFFHHDCMGIEKSYLRLFCLNCVCRVCQRFDDDGSTVLVPWARCKVCHFSIHSSCSNTDGVCKACRGDGAIVANRRLDGKRLVRKPASMMKGKG